MALPKPTQNGDKVRGVAAIGHTNPSGGGAANAYGAAFDKAGKAWTVSLCAADSDGDGLTNGLELGDPCCIWAVGKTPANGTDISNPGDNSSMTKRSCKGITCSNGVDPCTPKRAGALRGESA